MTVSEGSVTVMSDAYREKLEAYLAAMLQARRMLAMGVLTPEDYDRIDTIISKKYSISSCSLYCGIDLILSRFSGNMSYCKEAEKCK
jgi:hypothetical protein